MRRRLLALAIVAIAIAAFQIATKPPNLSPLDQTTAHWTFDRLRAWVSLRPSPTPGPAATDWLFVPGLANGEIPDCRVRSTGCWTPRALLVGQAFASAGTFNFAAVTHDVGIAVIDAGPARDGLDDVAGAWPLAGTLAVGQPFELVGYPGDRQYSRSALTFCSDALNQDDSASSPIWVAACDMTGGASGGAWVLDAESGSPAIVSVTSAGGGGKFLAGPVFDADTTALITAAETATANTVPGTKGRPGGLPCANRPLWACTKG